MHSIIVGFMVYMMTTVTFTKVVLYKERSEDYGKLTNYSQEEYHSAGKVYRSVEHVNYTQTGIGGIWGFFLYTQNLHIAPINSGHNNIISSSVVYVMVLG